MFCPACGVENDQENTRFCRACGTDLRAVSQALGKSVPVRLASSLDAYLENRFQRNFANGVLNLIAFVALIAVGSGHLIFGWLRLGAFFVGLGFLALVLGIWDIWIYRRNLPPVAKQNSLPSRQTGELAAQSNLVAPESVAEQTTRKLDPVNK